MSGPGAAYLTGEITELITVDAAGQQKSYGGVAIVAGSGIFVTAAGAIAVSRQLGSLPQLDPRLDPQLGAISAAPSAALSAALAAAPGPRMSYQLGLPGDSAGRGRRAQSAAVCTDPCDAAGGGGVWGDVSGDCKFTSADVLQLV